MGSTTNPPVSLAPFAFDWVAGDIPRLGGRGHPRRCWLRRSGKTQAS
jgi:hypothetical protein